MKNPVIIKSSMKVSSLGLLAGMALSATTAFAGESRMRFDEALIPRFNVPEMTAPPKIDGTINPDEWRGAAKVMGVVRTHSLEYKDRPVSFWLAWDATHLYIAARSDVLPGHKLYRSRREPKTTGTVFDDAYEFGIFMHDRNKLEGEVSSFLKMVMNSLGAAEYMKIYPSIGQNIYNWSPDTKIANRVYEADGRQWWDMEMAMDLKDLQMPVENKAGDKMDILLAADLKNPDWQWLDFPSATGHLEQYGFPRTTLTADQPYVQVERFSGLHDEKIDMQATIFNPSKDPVSVTAALRVTYNPPKNSKESSREVVAEKQSLTIPAGGSVPFKVLKDFPGLVYDQKIVDDGSTKAITILSFSDLRFDVTRDNAPDATPVYHYACKFGGTDKSYLNAVPRTTPFEASLHFNSASNKIEINGDTLDAKIPEGSQPAALTYVIEKDGKTVKSGQITRCIHSIYTDIIELPTLAPGKYEVAVAIVDGDGKTLVSRKDLSFEKKDEAKEFSKWWNNKVGDTEKLLPPFEALKVKGNTVTCTRREYQLDGLGLPKQIVSNGGNVLTGPTRIVVTVGGKEQVVPTEGRVKFTSTKDWRLEFTGATASAAGLNFTVKGWMEQDGLVNLDVTFAPQSQPVAIDDLRIEWPVDDALGNWMSCIGGVGGNYAPRTIGKVAAGSGVVWNTLSDIGKAGSLMLVGNWQNNLWVGNEQRGLCWFGDSDEGWVPNDATPAHSLFRDGKSVVIRNHLINLPKGEKGFLLDAPRTVNLQYNATPFRHFAKGWRITQVSAANGFSSPDYKANEKENNKQYFSVLSMPSRDTQDWPYYLAKYKAAAEKITAEEGWFSIRPRLHKFLTNQIALRGYMEKTLEPGLYDYFRADWNTDKGGESLNKTYRDYMAYLMNMQVQQGGCAHFYFDISFSRSTDALIAGLGYRLADGRVQPGSQDGPLREWYKRTWAIMAENGLYPGGVSGHATNSIALRALPWTDAILDSEYPMKDPITVYPMDRMIAQSCPHSFGVNINHLGFMNPAWASLHDAGEGDSGIPFNTEPFRHFGIAANDVVFLPYWRNSDVVKPADSGVLASVWKRPGKAVIQVLNYGLDPEGQEKTRSAKLTLDLKALGVPAGVKPEQIRISEMLLNDGRLPSRYMKIFSWYDSLPENPRSKNDADPKVRPVSNPTIDLATGVIDGVELFYHDSRYLLVTWDEELKTVPEGLFSETDKLSVLNWGLNRSGTKSLDANAVSALVKNSDPAVQVKAWTRPGTAMLLLTNTGAKELDAELTLDLDKLGVKVPKIWNAYTQAVGAKKFNAATGETTVNVKGGQSKVVFVDTY